MDILHIACESDFEKIRLFNNTDLTFKIIIDSDIKFTKLFVPIRDKEKYTIYIEGNNHTLSSINIYDTNDKVGIFSKVKNLIVDNLTIKDSSLYGGLLSGILCGDVDNNAIFNNINTSNVCVTSTAYTGGVVGYALNLSIKDSNIVSIVSGDNFVGGLAGMVHKYEEKNTKVASTVIAAARATAIDNTIGMCDEINIIKDEKRKGFFKRFHL